MTRYYCNLSPCGQLRHTHPPRKLPAGFSVRHN
jgi:hypothetical protein